MTAYVDHDQYTREERKILNERGQPIITINKIADKVQLLCGMERKARTDPKAYPEHRPRKTGQTPPLNAYATSQTTTFSLVRSHVFESMLVEGAGGIDLGLEDDGQGSCNVTMTHIPWDRIWYDRTAARSTSATPATRAWSSGPTVMRSRRCIPARTT